ncbi:MAG: MBL fold metallo-hydrolase [Candidatus Bathyarchaeota archaeon]|nr:MAG: MBL fold metallo-hydrolase [Candidatus Bathyarchaeota archaeon]
MSFQIKCLGATQEIGRSAFLVGTNQTKLLLDYGTLMGRPPGFPMHVPPKEVDAIIPSHAHLDHTGGIPIFHIRGEKPVFCTGTTLELVRLLISDFIHLSGYYLPFEYLDLENMVRNTVSLNYGKEVRIGGLRFSLIDAGHIPGSSQVLIKSRKKRVLYTGDINTTDTQLLKGAPSKFEEEFDAVIIESTYASSDHPNRGQLESQFVEETKRIADDGGTVLIPAFGVGRSQEILCMLANNGFPYPISVDGMARKTNELLLHNPDSLRDPKSFREAVHKANTIRGWRDRRNAAKRPGAIVAPAGMLSGGTAVFYLERLFSSPKNAIYLVSFQGPETPGRELLETGRVLVKGKTRKAEAEVKQYDFSSHSGRKELHDFVKSLRGDPTIITVHGDEDGCKTLADDIRDDIGFSATAPKAGDIFKI